MHVGAPVCASPPSGVVLCMAQGFSCALREPPCEHLLYLRLRPRTCAGGVPWECSSGTMFSLARSSLASLVRAQGVMPSAAQVRPSALHGGWRCRLVFLVRVRARCARSSSYFVLCALSRIISQSCCGAFRAHSGLGGSVGGLGCAPWG